MARIREQDIQKSIDKNRKLVDETVTRNKKIQERTEKVIGWSIDDEPLHQLDFSEETTFEEARGNQKALTENVAILIHGLDQATSAFGDDFKTMSETTFGERMMAIISKRKAEAMRSERVRNTDLTANLDQLIEKSNALAVLLREGREQTETTRQALFEDFPKIREQIKATATERLEVEEKIEDIKRQRADIEIAFKDVANDIEKRKLETQYAELNTDLNKTDGRRQSLTATEQSLDRYSSQFQNYLASLDTQLAAQETLIDKLELDSQKRALLYSALGQSIKLTSQQDVAHRVNEIGTATDAFAEKMMSNNKQASENKMIDMFESHKQFMEASEQVSRANAESDKRFKERFSGVIEDMDQRVLFVEKN